MCVGEADGKKVDDGRTSAPLMPTKIRAPIVSDDAGTKGSGSRNSSEDIGNRLTDEDVKRWFVRDPTCELRTQLLRTVQTIIALGFLKEGDAVPGIKRVARLVGIYPSVLFFVYNALEEQGVLSGEQGRGFFVVDPLPARLLLASEELGKAIHLCRRFGLNEEDLTRVFKSELSRKTKKRS